MSVVTVFEIRKTKTKQFGRIEVRDEPETPNHFGLYFYIGPYHRGYTPVRRSYGIRIAIGRASRLASMFALQNACRYTYREERCLPKLRPAVGIYRRGYGGS